jgi:hypothetical protein
MACDSDSCELEGRSAYGVATVAVARGRFAKFDQPAIKSAGNIAHVRSPGVSRIFYHQTLIREVHFVSARRAEWSRWGALCH